MSRGIPRAPAEVTVEPRPSTEPGPGVPAIRVGLAIGRDRAPGWVGTLIRSLLGEPDLEVSRLDVAPAPAIPRRGLASALLAFYRRADGRLFGRVGDPSTPVRLAPVLGGLPVVPAAGVDVVLLLAGARLETPDASPDGASGPGPLVLRLRHESIAGAQDPGDIAGDIDVADTLARTPHTSTALVATIGGAERIVSRVVSATDTLSARRSGRNHWPKVALRPLAALEVLRREGELPSAAATMGAIGSSRAAPVHAPRSAIGVAAAGGRALAGYLVRLADRTIAPERWVLAMLDPDRDGPGTTAPGATAPGAASRPPDGLPDPHVGGFRIAIPPGELEWADPFPVTAGGTTLLFVEEYVRSRHRGHIAVLELDGGGVRGPSRQVLDLPHHASYPFVFCWEDTWYLMPEQASSGSLQLYRAVEFPTRWAWDRTVLDLPAADATIAEIDGRWWLFTALPGSPGGTPDELHLYHAPSPLGPWEPHVANPVVQDVRTARPAGRIFRDGTAWYRPAQNGGPTYGYSVVLLRIDRLDDARYGETPVREILPGWAPRITATHTVNRAGSRTVIDARLREPRWRRADRRPPAG